MLQIFQSIVSTAVDTDTTTMEHIFLIMDVNGSQKTCWHAKCFLHVISVTAKRRGQKFLKSLKGTIRWPSLTQKPKKKKKKFSSYIVLKVHMNTFRLAA